MESASKTRFTDPDDTRNDLDDAVIDIIQDIENRSYLVESEVENKQQQVNNKSSEDKNHKEGENVNFCVDTIEEKKMIRYDDPEDSVDVPYSPSMRSSDTIRPTSQIVGVPGAHAISSNNNNINPPSLDLEHNHFRTGPVLLNATVSTMSSLGEETTVLEARTVDDVVQATAKPMEWWTPRSITNLVLGLSLVVGIIVTVLTVVLLRAKDSDEENTPIPTLPPEERWQALQSVLITEAYSKLLSNETAAPLVPLLSLSRSPQDNNESLLVASSPQYQALQWLSAEDSFVIRPSDANVIQRYALAVLYYATGGGGGGGTTINNDTDNGLPVASWIESFEFLGDGHECSWSGALVCDDAQQNVTGILLPSNGLSQSLPAELAFLTQLKILDLGGNDLVGTLPPALESLTYMGLNENAFTGSIPSSYTQMTNLRTIHLQKNELSGTIPENIGNLRELTSLDFEDNRLTGRIPDSMWELSHMEVFILDTQKQLEGSIPTTVGLWKNCTMFLVNVLNGLTGSTIPTEIGLLTNLIEFKTAQNHMRGTVSN